MYLGKASSITELKKIDLCAALWAMLSYEQQKAVERLAPSHIEVPTGSHIRLEYRIGAEAPCCAYVCRSASAFWTRLASMTDGVLY